MRRRDFLRSSALLATSGSFSFDVSAANALVPEFTSFSYLAAAKSRLGETSFVCLNENAELICQHDTPSRGHSFARSVQGHVAAIGRRPADFCLILDQRGNKVSEFNAAPSRHFYGHGVYDDKGEHLYLTENDYGFQGSRGVIGVYSVAEGYARVGEFESGGIGPHQIVLSADGLELIVANGGIQTHPEAGRKKLNLDSMQPNLAFIDRKTGKLRQKYALDQLYSKNSIRHMAQHSSGRVYLALQQQVLPEPACLLACFDPYKQSIEKMPLSQEHETQLSAYIGDIALDESEQYLALSSPYGNVLLVINLFDGDVQSLLISDVCGLSKAANGSEFIASTGDGKIISVQVSAKGIAHRELSSRGPSG